MDRGTIERELRIAASPEVVFAVISQPEHIRGWWGAETTITPEPGSTGALAWTDAASGEVSTVPITVVEVDPPRRFAFRWTQAAGEAASAANSLLVTFDLEPVDGGTRLRFAETGYRERDWEIALLEETYQQHAIGWDRFLPRIAERATRVVTTA
ncbi:SRPBCC domain-containing protein [Patulibacter defluvii]|uniref:SRPBCC domain-containing protein n=1 Tax=Patulibacter defluvii TaxID=3095358 RepID=UPI002A75B66D|nr:SRPBCC domain-containing protein [Patulibacter sp. DM4]